MNAILLTLSFYLVVAFIYRSRKTTIDPDKETKQPIKLDLNINVEPAELSLFLLRAFISSNPEDFHKHREHLKILPKANREDLIHFLRRGYTYDQTFNLIAHIQHAKSYGHKISAEQLNQVIKSFS